VRVATTIFHCDFHLRYLPPSPHLPLPLFSDIAVVEGAQPSHATLALEQDMAALFSLLLNAAAKTLDGILLGTNMTTPKTESFRLLDLPTEIRCMIYGYLTHDVKVELPDLGLPSCTTDTGAVENCFYPSVMLVCQQMRSEYAAVTTPAMRLRVCIGTYGVDDIRKMPRDAEAHCSVLHERVLAQITRLDIEIRTGCGGWPHCGILSPICSNIASLLTLTWDIDYLPAVQNLFHRMAMMSQASFKSSFYIDQLVEAELDHPAEFINYRTWIDHSLNVFPTMTCPSSCQLRVSYEIRCDLFCPLSEDDPEGPTSELIFGACSGPEEDTFKFHNLHLKFDGEEEVGDENGWWHGAGDED
jgi:hypothetical protein